MSEDTWRAKARIKLEALRLAAAERHVLARTIAEARNTASMDVEQARAELRFVEALKFPRGMVITQDAHDEHARRLEAARTTLATHERIREDLNSRYVALANTTDPAGHLFSAAERICKGLGV